MEILLDGDLILNKETLFKVLKQQINSEEFYGSSLDALWDVLSYGVETLEVNIKNRKKLEDNLGDYLVNVLELFNELSNNNVNVSINFI